MTDQELIDKKKAKIEMLEEIQESLCSMELSNEGRRWCERRIETLEKEIKNIKG